ncbi:centromere protein Q [Perognathus longimembris pacificus]|uniref:centromere protein Q n=1 Tax=Perognathus longimembris pacificus TaxID=214514 RepID=UPI0020198E1D|nr:centromere protein Q [Perognathus longimembris pacificus]
MSGEANASKEKSTPLKRNSERKVDEKVALKKKSRRSNAKRNKVNPKHLSPGGQAKCTNLKQIKIASRRRKFWQPLSKSTKQHLKVKLESLLLTTLGQAKKNKRQIEQIQYHLNFLHKSLLQQCETLKAPRRKLSCLSDVSNLLKMEKAQEIANEAGLVSLQEEINRTVEAIKSMEENIVSMKSKVQKLAHDVEKEEGIIQKVLQLGSKGLQSLPKLCQESLRAPTLHEEILTRIPNQNALLKDLNVLHSSSQVQNITAFIKEAYEKLDSS